MRALTSTVDRSRLTYSLLFTLVIGVGLLWRSGRLPLPPFWAKYGGDGLWALAVFLGLGVAFRQTTPARVGLCALAFSWTVEFLQLYHAPWIETLRATVLGRLVLGTTFNVPDLFAYALGIALGVVLEGGCYRAQPPPS